MVRVHSKGLSDSLSNFWILPLYLIAAGLDFRLSDIGARGPNVNFLEMVTIIGLGKILLDSLVFPRIFPSMVKKMWESMPALILYYCWIVFAALIGLLVYAKSIFIVRNLFPTLVFSLFLVYCVKTPKQLQILFCFFLIAALPNVFLGALQYFLGKPYLVVLNMASAVKMDLDGTFVRNVAAGLYSHPNGLSIFMLPVVVVSGAFVVVDLGQSFWSKLMALGFFLVAVIVLYGTRAKGAWLWSLFSLGLLVLPSWFYRVKGAAFGLVVFLILIGSGITFFSLGEGGKTLSTMWTRVYLWNTAISVFSHDFFATLFGSAQLQMWYASAKFSDLQYDNAHNTFLNQMVNFGLFALVLYTLNILISVKKACEAIRHSDFSYGSGPAKLAAALILGISGQYFFEPAAESSGYALTFVFFIAIPSLLQNMREGANEL